jgi:probable rRNA maturation factor
MILLDPELDPDPAPSTTSAKQASAPDPGKSQHIPSVGTLSRFLSLARKTVRLKGQVTVLLTTDAAIRKLNRQFRGLNKATDVLSFPAEGLGAEGYAGDLAISVPTARKQAAAQGHSLSTEIKVLILHGLLHLVGYDHEVDEGQMGRRERLLRGKLGLPQGLIERVENPVSQKSVILSDRSVEKGVEGPAVRPAKQAIKPRVPQVSILRPGKPQASTSKWRAKP